MQHYEEEFDPNPELHHNNLAKHGITLQQAQDVFTDPYRIEEYDRIHSTTEHRYTTIGILPSGKIVFVSFTMRSEKYRLISAREATREEKRQYAEHLKKMLGL